MCHQENTIPCHATRMFVVYKFVTVRSLIWRKKDVFLRLALHCEYNVGGCQDSLKATTSDSTHSECVLSAARVPVTCIVSGALCSKALNLVAERANSPKCMHLAVLVQTQVVGVRRLGSLNRVSILPINWCQGIQAAHSRDCGPFVSTTALGLGWWSPGSHGKKRVPKPVLWSPTWIRVQALPDTTQSLWTVARLPQCPRQ